MSMSFWPVPWLWRGHVSKYDEFVYVSIYTGLLLEFHLLFNISFQPLYSPLLAHSDSPLSALIMRPSAQFLPSTMLYNWPNVWHFWFIFVKKKMFMGRNATFHKYVWPHYYQKCWLESHHSVLSKSRQLSRNHKAVFAYLHWQKLSLRWNRKQQRLQLFHPT